MMGAILAAAGALLARIFASRIGGWVVGALIWLGLSITTYKFGVEGFRSLIANEMGQAGFLINWLGFFGVDEAITIVLSAIAAKYAVQGAKVAFTRSAGGT